jgi:HAD superfamily hydrolase (TIGR01484 family)
MNALPWPRTTLANLRGVLCDIDDTLTTGGRLTAAAYRALERLHETGLIVVPVTGRPAGWCDQIARFWPVDAVVGENGAFYFRYDHAAKRMIRSYLQDDATRAAHRARLQAAGADVLRQVPGSAIAADQHYREADLAIDYCEDVAPLSPEAVARVVEILRGYEMTVKVSSIHVNAWFGDYDKLAMTKRLLRSEFGVDLDDEHARARFVFVGDSPNDEPMFRFFPLSAAVANIARFADQLRFRPAHVTRRPSGAGFAELARQIIDGRKRAR